MSCHKGRFTKGSERTREAGRKGGEVRAAQRRVATEPYGGTILDMMDAAGLVGDTWAAWRVFLKAVFALPMSAEELAVYRRHTEREKPPERPVDEGWMPVGRRGGKSRIAALVALYLAIRYDHTRLAPGELAVVPIIAADRRQSRAVLGYLRGFGQLPDFAPWVERELKEAVELRSGVNIETHTASYRTTRGYTIIAAVLDEIAFWRTDDGSANPDSEIVAALRPGMATVPGSLLLGLSSPYAARGELHKAHERSFGKADPHVLVWNSDTVSMNPSVPARIIERSFEEDPVSAASEYGRDGRVSFRHDVAAFLDPLAVRSVTVQDRRELPPLRGPRYYGFTDPSGGSRDSFTLAIAHNENGTAVLDLAREVRPPFSPDSVVQEFAAVLAQYGVREVVGDRYAAGWVVERFQRHGVQFKHSQRSKSELYLELLPLVNAGTCALLDIPRLRHQLIGLERRTARGGKDSVDHPPGGRDDVANAVAGAVTLAAPRAGSHVVTGPGMNETLQGLLDGLTQPGSASLTAGSPLSGDSGAAEHYEDDPFSPDYQIEMVNQVRYDD